MSTQPTQPETAQIAPGSTDLTRWLTAMGWVRRALQDDPMAPDDMALVASDLEPDAYSRGMNGAAYCTCRAAALEDFAPSYRNVQDAHDEWERFLEDRWTRWRMDADLVLVCEAGEPVGPTPHEWIVDLNNYTVDGELVPEEWLES